MRLNLLLLLALASLPAQAQWHWTDLQGRPVYSDMAPPSDIPEKNIIRRPGARPAADVPSMSASAASPAVPTISGTDKALLEKKSQAEKEAAAAQAARRQAEEARQAQMQADSCARARQAQAGLSSGVRIARTNAKGEREFLDDAARAQEAQRIQAIIDADCK